MSELITTKQQMYRLLMAGRFGNYPRAWDSLEAIEQDGYTGHVSLRSREIANPVRLYHVPFAELRQTIAALPPSQRDAGLMFSESPPDLLRTIQGEYDGRALTYSFVPKPTRPALAEQCLHADYVHARLLLRRYLEPGDWDWLQQLVDDFPQATIEFSGFTQPVGVIPGSHCIFWEVRHY